VALPRSDRVHRHPGRLQRRRAVARDGRPGDRLPSEQRRHDAPHVEAVLTAGQPAAEVQVIDAVGRQRRDLRHRSGDDVGDEVVGSDVDERTLERARDRRARGRDDDGLRHPVPPRAPGPSEASRSTSASPHRTRLTGRGRRNGWRARRRPTSALASARTRTGRPNAADTAPSVSVARRRPPWATSRPPRTSATSATPVGSSSRWWVTSTTVGPSGSASRRSRSATSSSRGRRGPCRRTARRGAAARGRGWRARAMRTRCRSPWLSVSTRRSGELRDADTLERTQDTFARAPAGTGRERITDRPRRSGRGGGDQVVHPRPGAVELVERDGDQPDAGPHGRRSSRRNAPPAPRRRPSEGYSRVASTRRIVVFPTRWARAARGDDHARRERDLVEQRRARDPDQDVIEDRSTHRPPPTIRHADASRLVHSSCDRPATTAGPHDAARDPCRRAPPARC
jgi:hypothetical protein